MQRASKQRSSRCNHANSGPVVRFNGWTQLWVVVVLRSPIHANEPSEYNGMLYRASNRVLNNGIKVIILICMDGTSQYHHHPTRCVVCLSFVTSLHSNYLYHGGLIHLLSGMPLVTLSVKPCMLFFIQTLPRILCVGDISRVSFLDLFGPIAGATNPIMT